MGIGSSLYSRRSRFSVSAAYKQKLQRAEQVREARKKQRAQIAEKRKEIQRARAQQTSELQRQNAAALGGSLFGTVANGQAQQIYQAVQNATISRYERIDEQRKSTSSSSSD